MKEYIQTIVLYAIIIGIFYLYICMGAVFMWRNPKANTIQMFRKPVAVLTFKRLPTFQE